MARFVPILFAVAFLPAPALAQSAIISAKPLVAEEPQPEPDFDVPDDPANLSAQRGSRIIAGTEVIPNTMLGFGLFGEKAENSTHAPATARDFTLPKSRKAAVGFSLRF